MEANVWSFIWKRWIWHPEAYGRYWSTRFLGSPWVPLVEPNKSSVDNDDNGTSWLVPLNMLSVASISNSVRLLLNREEVQLKVGLHLTNFCSSSAPRHNQVFVPPASSICWVVDVQTWREIKALGVSSSLFNNPVIINTTDKFEECQNHQCTH